METVVQPQAGFFSVLRGALADVWSDLWLALVIDFIWLLLVALVIPAPHATLALFYIANRKSHGDLTPSIRDFFAAMKRYRRAAWRWGLVNLVVVVLVAGDIYLVGRGEPTPTAQWIQGGYLALATIWLLVQLYALPFLFEQSRPSVRQALRNSALMLARSPFFMVGLALSILVMLLFGMGLFLLTVGFGAMFVAAAANHAVLNRLGRL